MKIMNCRTNHLIDPIGYDLDKTVLSWYCESEASVSQKAARVVVSKNADMTDTVYDSGLSGTLDNRGAEVVFHKKPYSRYYWTVAVVGDSGDEAVSGVNWFETGKMQDDWTAKWITPSWEDNSISPYMRKSFILKKKVKRARAYITGLGLYELEINGSRIGDERLTPFCNAYDKWVQYQTYDITEVLESGANAVGVLLGNGWAKGRFGTFGDLNAPYVNEFSLICELHIEFDDGDHMIIDSDESWRCHRSPVIEDSIYDGEVYDANRHIDRWSSPELDDGDWHNVKCIPNDRTGDITERLSPAVLVKETIVPKLLITESEETVLDFGQNMVGWIRFKTAEPKGNRITILHGELLQNGSFYNGNLRTAKARYEYISDGETRTVEPHFTYFGFRYAKLVGFTEEIRAEDFQGCVLYSDIDQIGHIDTSDKRVNRLFENALWSQKGNFIDVPTDCPQRDERMAWTGDAQVFSGTAMFNMDTYAFYRKFLKDLYEEQQSYDGMVTGTVPMFIKDRVLEQSLVHGGTCGWSDAATIIPWNMYLHTGDVTILEQQFQSMKDWVNWIIRKDTASGSRRLWTGGFQFGDWLALDADIEGGEIGSTDTDFLATAYYYHSCHILTKTAGILGREEDKKYYGSVAAQVKKAFQDEYISANGRMTIHTQTACVIALQFGLCDEKHRRRIVDTLIGLLQKSEMHLKTGFLGTPFLCRALSDNDASKEAYQVFFRDKYPGWLYEVAMGATTIWERWNSVLPDGTISGEGMNSLNHYSYGSIMEWAYRNVCGIKPLEEVPGFKKFVISPEVNTGFSHVDAEVKSPMGIINVKWEIEGGYGIKLTIRIPFGSEGLVKLKNVMSNSVFINMGDSQKVPLSVEYRNEEAHFGLKAGIYTIHYKSRDAMPADYSLSTPLWVLRENVKTKDLLKKYCPMLAEYTDKNVGFKVPYSIQEILDGDEALVKSHILKNIDVNGLSEGLDRLNQRNESKHNDL